VATYIFDLMEKFAGYGFNKSHSAAYALLSYQTAWLKAHHPAPFMAAVLSADMDNTDKVVNLTEECRRLELQVLPPDINRSEYRFTVLDDRTILYGLGAIKGVGESAISGMLEERRTNGEFADLDDLCRRMIGQKVNRRVLEAMIRGGALDPLGHNRASLMAHLPGAVQAAEQHRRDADLGQVDLFGAQPAAALSQQPERLPEWPEDERLRAEKETLGLYLTGHPIERYAEELRHMVTAPIETWLRDEGGGDSHRGRGERKERIVVVAGLVVGLSVRSGSSGRFAFVTLDDRTGRLDVGVFGEEYESYSDLLIKDSLLVIEAGISIDHFSGRQRVNARRIFSIEQARSQFAHDLELTVSNEGSLNGFIGELEHILKPFRQGGCRINIRYRNRRAQARLALGETWRVRPSDELLHRLQQLAGDNNVRLRYANGEQGR
jgi:DNA polymerase-3 subunit alpha